MTVRVYYSSDVGAPTLSGTVGSMISLLDACLVTGYGSKQAAGWTKAFTGTNVAAYKFNTPGIGDYYFYVDDTGTGSAAYARIKGYEVMTSISDFTSNQMPLETQVAGGLYLHKSSAANTSTRLWCVIASETAFYLYVDYSSNTGFASADVSARCLSFFGRCPSYKSGDAWAVAAITHHTSAPASGSQIGAINHGANMPGHYMARTHMQTGQSVGVTKISDGGIQANGSSCVGSTCSSYPDPVTGGFTISPVNAFEFTASARRAKIPGMWALCHSSMTGFNCGDTFQGTGALADKTFIMLNCYGGNNGDARFAIEISNTW